jgi:hypothetical protein
MRVHTLFSFLGVTAALAAAAAVTTEPIFRVYTPKGLDFVLRNSATPNKFLIETMPGGCCAPGLQQGWFAGHLSGEWRAYSFAKREIGFLFAARACLLEPPSRRVKKLVTVTALSKNSLLCAR